MSICTYCTVKMEEQVYFLLIRCLYMEISRVGNVRLLTSQWVHQFCPDWNIYNRYIIYYFYEMSWHGNLMGLTFGADLNYAQMALGPKRWIVMTLVKGKFLTGTCQTPVILHQQQVKFTTTWLHGYGCRVKWEKLILDVLGCAMAEVIPLYWKWSLWRPLRLACVSCFLCRRGSYRPVCQENKHLNQLSWLFLLTKRYGYFRSLPFFPVCRVLVCIHLEFLFSGVFHHIFGV